MIWPGDEVKHELFCSLEVNSLETGTMTVFAFWFDRNKDLNYPFLGTRVIRGSRFLMIFTIRVSSYIIMTMVVPDVHAGACA